jgi:pimeloyl-ACP methyl ester carboxylesterase
MSDPTVPTKMLCEAAELEHGIMCLPESELPGTSHFLLQEKPALCNDIIVQFLTEDAVPTVAPIRRAG